MSRFFFSPACLCSGGGPLGNSTLTLAVWDLSRRLTTPKLKLQNLRVIACFFVFCLNLLHFFACVLRSHPEIEVQMERIVEEGDRKKARNFVRNSNRGTLEELCVRKLNELRSGRRSFADRGRPWPWTGCDWVSFFFLSGLHVRGWLNEVAGKVGFFTADYFRWVECLCENFSLRFLFHFAV